MRNGGTHFEQVPIEVVETVLRQAMAAARLLEKSPAPASALVLERHAAQILKHDEGIPSEGKL